MIFFKKPRFRCSKRVKKLVVLIVCSFCIFKQERVLQAVETHATFRTIYNPRMMEVYNPDPYSFNKQYVNPYLVYQADRQTDPIMRQIILDRTREYIRKQEMQNRLIHTAYQAINVRVLELGSKNGSLVLDGLMRSIDQNEQTQMSLRQMHYRHVEVLSFIKEIKLGRVLSTEAAGMSNYDGGWIQFHKGNFYMNTYGGILVDNDYLHKTTNPCATNQLHTSCLSGKQVAKEDYSNKWDASDVRNTNARERRGDTIIAMGMGYRSAAYFVDMDFQRKTDAALRTEERGGLNISLKPTSTTKVYGNSKVNLIKGVQHSTLLGVAQSYGNWTFMPEYEYYKPQFKLGSFWDSFHTFGRATTRFKVYRELGKNLRFLLSVGKLFYLADNTLNESLTTCTTVDPVTGDTIGCRDKAARLTPTNPLEVKGNPTATDPVTGKTQSVQSRPMTIEEALTNNYFNPPYKPKNGSEGQIGLEYSTIQSIHWSINGLTLQGPEGRLTKTLASVDVPFRSFRVRTGVGQAYFNTYKSDKGTEKASFATLEIKYPMTPFLIIAGGGEFYTDSHYKNDVRGKLDIRYAF